MNKDDLYTRVNELEVQVKQLQTQLQGMLDHPKTDLLPMLPTVVTGEGRLSFGISGMTLSVRQKGRTVGCVTLREEE